MLKEYDQDLFCQRDADTLHVYRKKPRVEGTFEYQGVTYAYAGVENQYIFSLTHNFKFGGRPVDWGIEPLREYLSEIDSWRDDTGYEKFVKARELNQKWKDESKTNEIRAIAADMRVDFAKATNDLVVNP